MVRVDGLHVSVRVRLAGLAPKQDRFRASCVSHVLGHAKLIPFRAVHGRSVDEVCLLSGCVVSPFFHPAFRP